MDAPKVKLHRTKEWSTDQPAHAILPSLPMRVALLGPSGSGKTQLIQSMIIDMYRTKGGGSCFSRIYIWSPSVHVDPAWIPVKRFCETVLHQDDEKEKFLFDTFNPMELDAVITTHKKVTALGKEAEYKKLWNALIILDDVADDPRIARNEKQIHELYFRGRHHKLSVLISTQRYRSIAPQIRTQCTALFVFRLRSHLELEAVLEEVSATYDKKTIAGFYREATEEPYSFLYIRLEAKKPEDMFWERFEYRLLP